MTELRSERRSRTRLGAAIAGAALVAGSAGLGATSVSATGEGEPQPGGTLIVAGDPDVLWMDPAAAYSAADYQFQRMTLRGLFDYPNSGTLEERATPLPDLAVEVPTEENGGVSADGLTYTIELRDDVMWNVDEPRPVVAEDVVRGVKRMCNPVQGSAARAYYLDTIAGMREFCDGFAEVAPEIEPIRDYIESTDIAGVTAVDDHTVQFTLTQPASDFVYLLALFRFTAPQPVEYLDYLADSPDLRQNIIENGPYQVVEYVPDQSYVLERNPNWDPETDDLREAYVDRIEITLGQQTESVFQQIIAGTVDMQWGETTVPTQEIPALLAAGDERLVIEGAGGDQPVHRDQHAEPQRRRCVRRPARPSGAELRRRQGGRAADLRRTEPVRAGLPHPASGGARLGGHQPARTFRRAVIRSTLASCSTEAGYPDGLPIKVLYDDEPEGRKPCRRARAGPRRFRVRRRVRLRSQRNAFYGEFLLNHEFTESGGWDIAAVSWYADYLAGRSYIPILLDGRGYESGTPNYGGYNNDELNGLIDEALAASTPEEAAALWAEADVLATEDAAWVPVGFSKTPTLHGDRVGGFVFHLVATQRRLHQRLARAVTRSRSGEDSSRTSTRFFPGSRIDTDFPRSWVDDQRLRCRRVRRGRRGRGARAAAGRAPGARRRRRGGTTTTSRRSPPCSTGQLPDLDRRRLPSAAVSAGLVTGEQRGQQPLGEGPVGVDVGLGHRFDDVGPGEDVALHGPRLAAQPTGPRRAADRR